MEELIAKYELEFKDNEKKYETCCEEYLEKLEGEGIILLRVIEDLKKLKEKNENN